MAHSAPGRLHVNLEVDTLAKHLENLVPGKMRESGNMTLILELHDNKEAALKAKAESKGISAEQYVQQILDHDLEETEKEETAASPGRHISDVIAEIMQDIPLEALSTLPSDGATEHDHYIYGWPKRNS